MAGLSVSRALSASLVWASRQRAQDSSGSSHCTVRSDHTFGKSAKETLGPPVLAPWLCLCPQRRQLAGTEFSSSTVTWAEHIRI